MPRRPPAAPLLLALLAGGSAAFLVAGSHHPKVGTALGALGSEAYFRAFADLVAGAHGWEALHAGILLGPVLWAVAGGAVADAFDARGRGAARAAHGLLLLGAALWAATFVLDGFVAPTLARALVGAESPAHDAAAFLGFRANQAMVARFGLFAVAFLGAGAAALAVALLAEPVGVAARRAVAAAGLLAGGWPVLAAATGTFSPGPFTSPWWSWTALALGGWFALVGVAIAAGARRVEAPLTT